MHFGGEDFDNLFKKNALEAIGKSKKGNAVKRVMSFSLQGFLEKIYLKYGKKHFFIN